MVFLSTKDVSEKWNISTTRIGKLASEGRIPGAKKMGKTWLIPSDAEKPLDKRKKEALPDDNDYFFPIMIFHHLKESELSQLPYEQQSLYDIQYRIECGNIDGCEEKLKHLIETSENRFVKIGALYNLCTLSTATHDYKTFDSSYIQLKILLSEDFPHKKDVEYIINDLDSLFIGSDFFIKEFSVDNNYNYSEDALMYFIPLSAYSAVVRSLAYGIRSNPIVFSLMCNQLMDADRFLLAQITHLYTASIYFINGEENSANHHVRQALDIAVEYGYIGFLSAFFTSNKGLLNSLLPDYPKEFGEKLIDNMTRYEEGLVFILKSVSDRSLLFSRFVGEDYTYLQYAVLKYTNKEIAKREGKSENTVSKRFASLCHKFEVNSKKELAELFIRTLSNRSIEKPED